MKSCCSEGVAWDGDSQDPGDTACPGGSAVSEPQPGWVWVQWDRDTAAPAGHAQQLPSLQCLLSASVPSLHIPQNLAWMQAGLKGWGLIGGQWHGVRRWAQDCPQVRSLPVTALCVGHPARGIRVGFGFCHCDQDYRGHAKHQCPRCHSYG